MQVLRQILGSSPSGPKARVRNFVASPCLGTESVIIHENVVSPGVLVPCHIHTTEEVIVVLSGGGKCWTENRSQAYSAGDVLILPKGLRHSIQNIGDCLLRQLCFFPGDPGTQFLAAEKPGQVVDVFQHSKLGLRLDPAR